ncbi:MULTISPECIES: CotY/CotZ family spore coat protein [unclassified Virgibacillus]|uniref:CotY/CotZ family spore coat protein n=1 Tax=unclassified Virgibacillus TaxID=2620237 RepID=UPI0024DE1650|nr:CotY/CotZ family spore coat protein [Virgibacillus sp. LDC-1]
MIHHEYKKHCVCSTVHKIVAAQDKKAAEGHHCRASCENSIKQLLSPRKNNNDKTIIPFILYCKYSCKPFIASGIFKHPIYNYPKHSYYGCLETPVLKAKKFIKGTHCCVQVELLQPVNANGLPVADGGDKLCDFFCHKTPYKTIQFRETGICLTIDLEDYSSIQCLDPITPLPPYHPC